MTTELDNCEIIVCPETRQPLSECDAESAQARIAGGGALRSRQTGSPPPYGVTDRVLVREDVQCAYPVVRDIPVLMVPEMLFSESQSRSFDLRDPKYAEAYEEMEYYNDFSFNAAKSFEETGRTESLGFQNVLRLDEAGRTDFLEPQLEWLDATYDCAAQWDAYSHFGAIAGKRVMQLGGSGIHAIKMLIGGAAEAWLLTPMLGEAVYARAVANRMGRSDAFHCAIGVGEELPFADGSFDVIFSGGCLHHMRTEVAFPEIHRVLRPGGRFGATDPWRAPLHTFGTRLFGKREASVFCRPLTPERVAPLRESFEDSDAILHGALTRYPLLALDKMGIHSSVKFAWRAFRIDDAISSFIPGLRRAGSSVALVATKGVR